MNWIYVHFPAGLFILCVDSGLVAGTMRLAHTAEALVKKLKKFL